MSDCCILLIEHLKEGKSSPIEEDFNPKALALGDSELSFESPIHVEGSGYLAEDHIVIQLDITGSAYLPCSVCNKPVNIPVILNNAYITKPLSDLSGGKLDFTEDLRETILLEIPSFVECHEGQCPERTHIEKYLKQPAITPNQQEEDVYYPFNGLDEQLKKK
jgi:uncharacterized metal-binding protein YceD (DUF177 family)